MSKTNIIVIGPNWIGDIILSLPALKFIDSSFKEPDITVVAGKNGCSILGSQPFITRVIPTPENNLMDFIRYKKRLAQYDIAFVFPNSFKSALLAFISGAKKRIGCNTDYRGVLLTKKLDPKKDTYTHAAVHFLNIAGKKGSELPEATILNLNSNDQGFAADYLKNARRDKERPLITIHPGASKIERAWHVNRFIKLCTDLKREYNPFFLIVGSKDERSLLNEFSANLGKDCLTTSGRETIGQLAALISLSSLFIGNDSGIMHLASFVGVPVVGIFGPGIKEQTGPLSKPSNFEIVTREFVCSPCKQNFFKECSPSFNKKPPCIEEIEVADVYRGINSLIGKIEPFKT